MIAVNCSFLDKASQGYNLTTDPFGENSIVLPYANLRENFKVNFYLNELDNLPSTLTSGEPMLLTCIKLMYSASDKVVCVDASPL